MLIFHALKPYKPWILLANLPYQITFPILHLLQRNRDLAARRRDHDSRRGCTKDR